MPEINLGFAQGSAIPFYVIIKNIAGDQIAQPPGFPTIEIAYIEPDTNIRRTSVTKIGMPEIETGRHFFVWRVPADEEVVNHVVIITGFVEGEIVPASDESFTITGLVQNPVFKINVNILENPGICFPEVMEETPKCRGRRQLPVAHDNEVDIGLNDFVEDGVFRFGAFPNMVVDRRVVSGTTFTLRSARNIVPSTSPGAGPAQRPGNPLVNTRYANRTKYRY